MMHSETRGRNDVAPQELVTLPEILGESGYRTVAVTGGGYMGSGFGLDQGFDVFSSSPSWKELLESPRGIEWQSTELLRLLRDQEAETEGPFFALLHTYEVHSPYESPDSYASLFGKYSSDFEPNSQSLKAVRRRVKEQLSPDDVQSIVAAYDRGIRYTDEVLGSLFARLGSAGLLENTWVILTSDHGEEFGEHNALLHPASLHDELLHVPLLVVGPGIDSSSSDPRLVSTLDVAPTILSLAGLAIPSWMQGRDLLAADEAWDESEAVYSQYGSLLYSVRTRRWKFIESSKRRDRLYDLTYDPKERSNVLSEFPEVAERLRNQLQAWRNSQPSLGDIERPSIQLDDDEAERLRALGYL